MFDGNLPESRKSLISNVGCETCETMLVLQFKTQNPDLGLEGEETRDCG